MGRSIRWVQTFIRFVQWEAVMLNLWRGGLPPLGGEAAPKPFNCGVAEEPRRMDLRLLRSRTGASPLATASPLSTGCAVNSMPPLEGIGR
jgi:hypothetical protein